MQENNTNNKNAFTRADLWWKQAVIYQIYPRSFKDSTGSGLGDINGVTSKMDYLKELGVDAIWLSPFYPSELADGGYDVEDYRNVDPRLGTMDDFDMLTQAAHSRGIKLFTLPQGQQQGIDTSSATARENMASCLQAIG